MESDRELVAISCLVSIVLKRKCDEADPRMTRPKPSKPTYNLSCEAVCVHGNGVHLPTCQEYFLRDRQVSG